jgi:hypothetical protein
MVQDRDAVSAARMDKWWADWWAADYSWEGLAKADKPWRGWVRPFDKGPCVEESSWVEGSPASLQDYFIDRLGPDLILIEAPDGRKFTRLHLPLVWPDGIPTEKADWSEDALDNDLWELLITASYPIEHQKRAYPAPDRHARCDGAVFLRFDIEALCGHLSSAQDGRLPLALCCQNAAFLGDASFRSAAFSGSANFSNAAFFGEADFSCAAFSSDASFHSAAFLDYTHFNSAEFSEYADFRSTEFSEYADFSSAAFRGEADFSSAVFSCDADFSIAAFSGDVYFSSDFSGHADFRRAAFWRRADFSSAAFCEGLSLTEAVFEATTTFAGAARLMRAPAETRDLTLAPTTGSQARSGLTGTVALAPNILNDARRCFPQISAENAVFVGDADFSNRDVLQPSSFAGSRFLGLADFHGSRLHQRVNLHRTRFEVLEYSRLAPSAARVGSRNMPGTREQGGHGLSSLLLLGKLLLRSLRVRNGQSLTVRFLRRELDFGRTTWPPFSDTLYQASGRSAWAWMAEVQEQRARTAATVDDRRYEAIEASFRTLKQAMEDTRARLSESDFFKLELKARRRRRDRDQWEQVFSDLYGITSDYGASAWRPVAWLAGTLVVSAAVYFGAVNDFTLAPPTAFDWNALTLDPDFAEALRYSSSRMLPFGALADDDWAWRDTLLSGTWRGGLMRTLATLQSILAAVLIFQLGLAVRRRFQIT